MGMQQTHVRLEKNNRKRKSDMEQREGVLEAMRQNMELTRAVTEAFKVRILGKLVKESFFQLVFMHPSEHSAESPTLPLKIVPITNMEIGRELFQHFMEMVTAFKELPQVDKNFLLAKRVPIMMVNVA